MSVFVPTQEQRYSVELMAGIGIIHDEIACAIGVTDTTLRKHFKPELSVGKTRIVTRVADSLVRQALAGNITAAIFFLKTRGGWKEAGGEANGKKEQLGAKAKATGIGRFATPATPPKLVVSNA